MTLVSTAIIAPRVSHEQIERPHLAALTEAVGRSRVTTVFAPAGYGKTMAALQWADALSGRGRPVLWLAARAGIDSFDDFLGALGAAASAAGMARPNGGAGRDAARCFAELVAQQPIRPLLVLDDAQLLPQEAFDFLAELVVAARDALTTVIVSRSLNIIPIARLRALGYLLEVGVQELRFSAEESARLLTAISGMPAQSDHLGQLVEDTQGWPAGLAMACVIQDGQRRNGDLRPVRVSGLRREFECYFNEEVVSREPKAVRDFIIDTIVIDDLTPAACAAVTGREDARAMLQHVEASGLFLNAVDADRSSYRYHPLFRQVVIRRLNDLDPVRAAELQRRASRYFASAGDPIRAIEHARLSGDSVFLVDQLDALAHPLVYAGELALVNSLVAGMHSSVFARRPRLALAIAWRRIRSLSFESAEAFIAMAEAELARWREEDREPLDIQHLERVIAHRRVMLAAARDDMETVKIQSEPLLRELGEDEPYLSCTLLAQLMASRRELYHFQDMLRLEAEVRRALGRPGSEFAAIALKATVAPTLAVQGKSQSAETMLREALDHARRGNDLGVAALPALPLAELLYDRGALAEARALVDEFLPVAREWSFVDQIAAGHLVNARLLFVDGDFAGAQAALEDMQVLAIECGLDRLRAMAVSEQVCMLLRRAEPKQARAVLERTGMMTNEEPYPTLTPTRQQESIAVAVIRLAMQDHRLVQARKLAKRWSELARRTGAVRSGVIFSLLLAEIAVLAGDRSEARRLARDAVMLAAPSRWVRLFLDEGEAIRSLILEAYGKGPRLESLADQFGQELFRAFHGATPAEKEDDYGLSSRLMHREIDILRMVGGGLRNREIGDRLGLTEGTVKWYMQQIYDKLGVRRRPQAVMRARQLGVLS